MKFLPFWALLLAISAFEVGIYYHRKKNNVKYSLCGFAGFLGLSTVLWLIFRGDIHSDQWVRSVFGG